MPLNVLGLVSLLALGGQKGPEPDEALRRSFDRRPGVNVDALVEKRFGSGDSMTIRMIVDANGRRRTEVLAPMVVQGRVFLDDGTTWTAYFPDRKLLQVHPAPPDVDLGYRMHQVRKNYRLEIDSRPNVAGRPALRVVATPHDPALKTQRFYLDVATGVPLKSETVDGMGNILVQFRVVRIAFPPHLDKDAFDPPDVEGTRRENRRPPQPVPIKDPGEAAGRLGFLPAMPRWIPTGFRPQGADLLDGHGVVTLAIRLSDGLVRANVYQSRVGDAPPPPMRPGEGPKVSADVGTVRVEVRGEDVPLAVRERILAVYVKKLQEQAKAP